MADTIVVTGDVHGLVGRRAELIALMRETQERVRAEPGCRTFTFAEALDEPARFVLVEEWAGQAALDAHFATPGFADYAQRVTELLARPTDLRIHTVASTLVPEPSGPMDPRKAD